jgi:alpha-mannosidase
MSLSAHIVTHTHWDREWYQPLERFRQRLVALIDELLNWPPDTGESFLLDGQAIVAEDYLTIRPDRADTLAQLLGDGRIEAGPWYVLADELIPSGEALVRNLLAGRRSLRRLGATPPPVLYCPDSFGHPAALPTIARGFGLPLVILWRGYGGARWPAGDTARWIAPNGDDVILFHLPRDGYEYGSHLPAEESNARDRWERMRGELAERSKTGVLLIPHGADHHAKQHDHDEAIAMLEHVGAADGVRRSSLTTFARELIERSREADLPHITGELRDSYGYTWTLQGTFGTRAAEKRLNAVAERLLIREVEPWSALASRVGGRSRRPFVESAWRSTLAAHPHDTLCGCSIDAVAVGMEVRLQSAIAEGSGVRDDAIADLIGHDSVAARTQQSEWRPVVLLRNSAPRPRGGVAIVDVREFIADVPVGPGSAQQQTVVRAPQSRPRLGGVGPLQTLSRGIANDRVESPQHYPDNDLVSVTNAAVWVPEVPAFGILAMPIGVRSAGRDRPSEPVTVSAKYEMRNAHLVLRVDGDTVELIERATDRRVAPLVEIQDQIDVGDLYTPAPRGPYASPALINARIAHRGPLRGELALRWRLVPASRGPRRDQSDIVTRFVLDADAPYVGVIIQGTNRATDHRIRLAFRTDISSPVVWADAAYGPVHRERLVISTADAAMETPPPTAPLHRYVSLFDDSHGATVFSDGLAEYEATDDGSVLVTLVRGVGELSKNDLPERPGHAGWPVPTPGAQSLGPFEASFAVMLHGARTAQTIDTIDRIADDVLVPLTGTTLRSALAIPDVKATALLDGSGLSFSTLKESEDGEWLVARCVNLLDMPVTGRWSFGFPVADARLARLDETPTSALAVRGDTVDFEAPPRGVVTVLVR